MIVSHIKMVICILSIFSMIVIEDTGLAEGKKVTLSELIEIAVERNPEIQRAESLQRAGEAKVPQAGARVAMKVGMEYHQTPKRCYA